MSDLEIECPQFIIVTPSYNLEDFIEQTILSVITQAGDFKIHYHVQDGGSTDGTRAILEKWKKMIDDGTFPVFCKGVTFEHVTEKDSGMYNAINRGFAYARQKHEHCMMSWINADDLLPPGSLAAISSFLRHIPSVRFLGGRTSLMSESGFIACICDPAPLLREDICKGLYAGGEYGFIMQEGLFWKSDLWDEVDGLDESLRLAGDFDLWRRFAHKAEYYCIDTITGLHRKREGQLSGNMDAYLEETKTVMKKKIDHRNIHQPLLEYHYYILGEQKWEVSQNQIKERLVLRHVLDILDETVLDASSAHRATRKSKVPPWFLSPKGWQTRQERNKLVRSKRALQHIFDEGLRLAEKRIPRAPSRDGLEKPERPTG
ncbi:MAG: glycosyltransferase [Luteolibacter sp.]